MRIIICLSVLFLFVSANGYSQQVKIPKEEVEKGTQISGDEEKVGWASDKFARGITNILTGWVEIPKRIGEKSKSNGAGGAASGFAEGITWMLLRTGAGIWDAVTFPGSLIIPDEKPIIDPPTVFEKE